MRSEEFTHLLESLNVIEAGSSDFTDNDSAPTIVTPRSRTASARTLNDITRRTQPSVMTCRKNGEKEN